VNFKFSNNPIRVKGVLNMEQTDREILRYMVQDPDWHRPSKILKETGLKGRNPEKSMSINNIIKRCHFLVEGGFLKIPDPENDRDIYRMAQRKDGIFCIRDGVTISVLKQMVDAFSGTIDEFSFHHSLYIQKKINMNLLKYIVKTWYPNDPIPSPESDFVYIPSKEEEVFTAEDVLNILRLSPTAFKIALEGYNPHTNFLGLNEIITLSLLLDTRHLPMDNHILATIEFKLYGKLLKTEMMKRGLEEKKLYDTISGNPVRPKESNPMKISEKNEGEGVQTWEEAMESKILFKRDFLPIMKKRVFITV
jgi:hypothetical protein